MTPPDLPPDPMANGDYSITLDSDTGRIVFAFQVGRDGEQVVRGLSLSPDAAYKFFRQGLALTVHTYPALGHTVARDVAGDLQSLTQDDR